MNNFLEQAINAKLENNWANTVGAHLPCSIVHPHERCTTAAIVKFMTVFKIGCKYYFPLYFIQILVKLKNAKKLNQKSIKQILKGTGKGYLGSLLFMSFLVAGFRAGLCLYTQCFNRIDQSYLLVLASTFPTSTCIFFEEPSRREELTYFVMTRSLKSLFTAFDRRYMRNLPSFIQNIIKNTDVIFIFMTALLVYCSFQMPSMIKYNTMLSQMWGNQVKKQQIEKNLMHQQHESKERNQRQSKLLKGKTNI